MLDERRVKEAEGNVKGYLEEGLLKKERFEQIVFRVLTNNAKESLDIASFIAKSGKSDLWVIVTSYYSMYYIANAVLYGLGYKVGEKISHKVTADALIVFARKKLRDSLIESYEEAKKQALAGMMADDLLESFDSERKKRSIIQYQTQEFEKHSKAMTSLQRAKEFFFEMENLLPSPPKPGQNEE
jgi:uncharacterized protein (UPF0332 family)